jgi:hypothetical protein
MAGSEPRWATSQPRSSSTSKNESQLVGKALGNESVVIRGIRVFAEPVI